MFDTQPSDPSGDLRLDDVPFSATEQRNPQRCENGNKASRDVCLIRKNQRIQPLPSRIKIADADTGIHPDYIFGHSTRRPDLGALQCLIEKFELPLISKERILESPDQTPEPVRVAIGDDNATICHDELLCPFALIGAMQLSFCRPSVQPWSGFPSVTFPNPRTVPSCWLRFGESSLRTIREELERQRTGPIP